MPKTGVCNACKKAKTKCKYRKVIYRADKANNEYRSLLISSRNGTSLTGKELDTINKIVSEPIKNGQSPYQVITANKDKLPVSESTIRRLISSGELEARNIDLRNQVSRRKRRNSKTGKNETGITVSKLGHLHDDYLRLISHNDVSVVQMDCVEGSADSESVLLTLHLPEYHLQIAEILSHHTSECVVGALDKIESALGRELFTEIFEVILTDNGHEFSDIEAIEKSCFGGKRTKVFFCEPNRSDQKGECECNHKYIRYIIPKGTSMDHLSQFDINLMMNHINSSRRKSLRGKSPYQVAKAVLPEDFFILLGLEEIPDNEIILTPKLLKKSK
jgi:IS30 family transposase